MQLIAWRLRQFRLLPTLQPLSRVYTIWTATGCELVLLWKRLRPLLLRLCHNDTHPIFMYNSFLAVEVILTLTIAWELLQNNPCSITSCWLIIFLEKTKPMRLCTRIRWQLCSVCLVWDHHLLVARKVHLSNSSKIQCLHFRSILPCWLACSLYRLPLIRRQGIGLWLTLLPSHYWESMLSFQSSIPWVHPILLTLSWTKNLIVHLVMNL